MPNAHKSEKNSVFDSFHSFVMCSISFHQYFSSLHYYHSTIVHFLLAVIYIRHVTLSLLKCTREFFISVALVLSQSVQLTIFNAILDLNLYMCREFTLGKRERSRTNKKEKKNKYLLQKIELWSLAFNMLLLSSYMNQPFGVHRICIYHTKTVCLIRWLIS